MAVVYQCVGILTVDIVVFHSQDSFPSTFRSRLWETSSGVVAVGVFAAESRRELLAHLPRLRLIYVVHSFCCYVIGQHSDSWNLIGRFLYRCFLWSEVLLCTFLMQDTKFYVNTGIKEHERHCRLGDTERSAVAQHMVINPNTRLHLMTLKLYITRNIIILSCIVKL